MKSERTNVKFTMWRKKVDLNLFKNKGTVLPAWVVDQFGIRNDFTASTRKDETAEIDATFENKKYKAYITVQTKSRPSPFFRLWFHEELVEKLKKKYLMTHMRDLETRLRKEEDRWKVEEEIPFWEFLDIEYDRSNRIIILTAHYVQTPLFPELFRNLVGSHALDYIEEYLKGSEKHIIIKRDWKLKSGLSKEPEAENVIYMLLDENNKEIYVGEAKNLKSRLKGNRTEIPSWTHYRFDLLPPYFDSKMRLSLERMVIRQMSNLFPNNESVPSMQLSEYVLKNKKIDH